jgi:C4-dicarboxylate-binding protein DctP
VVSARLWEQGVTSAFEDSEYFPQYVPLVSAKLWHSLPADLQDLIMGTWEELVMPARALAAEAQESARATLKAHGIGITTPTAAALAAARQQLMTQQEQLIPALGIDPALARDVAAQLPP